MVGAGVRGLKADLVHDYEDLVVVRIIGKTCNFLAKTRSNWG